MKSNGYFSVNQSNISERNRQVSHMQNIYQKSEVVLIWLGPDSEGRAELAIKSIIQISDFLCQALGCSVPNSDLEKTLTNKLYTNIAISYLFPMNAISAMTYYGNL